MGSYILLKTDPINTWIRILNPELACDVGLLMVPEILCYALLVWGDTTLCFGSKYLLFRFVLFFLF